MKRTVAGTLTRIAIYAAFAAVLGYVESLLPPLFAFAPGVKIGLSNLAILLALVTLGEWQAVTVLAVKCLFGAIYGGNPFALVYSVTGGVAGLSVSIALVRWMTGRVSIVAVSVASAVINNAVQTAIAALISGVDFVLLFPFTVGASIIAGVCVGLVVWLVVRTVPARVLLPKMEQNHKN